MKNFTKLLEDSYVFMQNSSESHLRKSNFKVENRKKYAKTQQNSEISSKTQKKLLAYIELFPLLGILTFKACIWAIFRATAVN